MSVQSSATAKPPRSIGRSALGLLAGFVVIVALSIITDMILHAAGVYPPPDQPMRDTGLLALALAYRCVYAVLGCYVAARLAPSAPMRHALILGAIGLVISVAGAFVAISKDMSPMWYPIALAASTLPCAWIGAKLYRGGPV